jgi:hypothetical protein
MKKKKFLAWSKGSFLEGNNKVQPKQGVKLAGFVA